MPIKNKEKRNEYQKLWRIKNKDKTTLYNKTRVPKIKIKKMALKKKIISLFNNRCSICGYSKNIAALEFHHVENKDKNISYLINSLQEEKIKKELKKCILICANCHREIHYNHLML